MLFLLIIPVQFITGMGCIYATDIPTEIQQLDVAPCALNSIEGRKYQIVYLEVFKLETFIQLIQSSDKTNILISLTDQNYPLGNILPYIGTKSNYEQAIKNLLDYFGWNYRLVIISSRNIRNIQISQYLKQIYPNNFYFALSEDAHQGATDNIVFKNVKPLGLKHIICIGGQLLCHNINQSLLQYNLEKEGMVLLAIEDGCNGLTMDGSICLSFQEEDPNFKRTSTYLHRFRTIQSYVDKLASMQECYENNEQCYHIKIQDMLEKGYIWKDLLIYNRQNQGWKQVGSCSNGLHLQENLIFIGGTTKVPDSSKFKIIITANTDPKEVDGSIEHQIASYTMSFDLLIDQYNKSQEILPHHQLVRNDIKGCGVLIRDQEQVSQCVQNFQEQFGVAWIYSWFPNQLDLITQALKEQQLDVLLISNINPSMRFQDRKQFPLFASVFQTFKQVTGIYCQVFLQLDWLQILQYYDNWAKEYGDYMQEDAVSYGIVIENKNVVPLSQIHDLEYLEEDMSFIESIIQSQSRIILIFCHYNQIQLLPEIIYKYARNKGFIMIHGSPTQEWSYIPNEDKRYLLPVVNGSLSYDIGIYYGDMGQQLKELFQSELQEDNHLICQGADPLIFLIQSIDYCIRRGFDHENPYVLRFVMSGMRVRGCTGILKMVPDKNIREIDQFTFYSNMWVNGVYNKRPYFIFAPDSAIKLTYNTNFTHVWPDGTTGKVPAIRILTHDCYYENKAEYLNGQITSFAIIATMIVIVQLMVTFIYRKLKGKQLIVLQNQMIICWQDIMIMIGFIAEPLIILSYGFDLSFVYVPLQKIIFLVTINLDKLNNPFFLSKGIILGLFGGFFIILVITFIGLRQFHKNGQGFLFFRIGETFIPCLSVLCFTPLVHNLLQHFVCYKGANEGELNMYTNCDMPCYDTDYYILAIFTISVLILYTLISSICQIHWKSYYKYMHQVQFSSFSIYLRISFKLAFILSTFLVVFDSFYQEVATWTVLLLFLLINYQYGKVNDQAFFRFWMLSQAFPFGVGIYIIICKRLIGFQNRLLDIAFCITYLLIFTLIFYIIRKRTYTMLVIPKKINIEILLKFIANPCYLNQFYNERDRYRQELSMYQFYQMEFYKGQQNY